MFKGRYVSEHNELKEMTAYESKLSPEEWDRQARRLIEEMRKSEPQPLFVGSTRRTVDIDATVVAEPKVRFKLRDSVLIRITFVALFIIFFIPLSGLVYSVFGVSITIAAVAWMSLFISSNWRSIV